MPSTHKVRRRSKDSPADKLMTTPQPPHNGLKYISLVILIAQTTALVLILRYSKTQKTEGPRYLSSTAVLTAEVVKLITCVIVILKDNAWSFGLFSRELNRDCFADVKETLKIAVPAALYVVQNNLLFLALSKLDAATYQVTYQLKILTTAFFSVSMLNKKLNPLKWVALLLLTVGVALVQLPSGGSSPAENKESGKLVGLFAVIAACFSSGFAGVYFEKVLKTSNVTLWMRNLQLAFFSIFGGLFMCWLYDSEAISNNGFFQGYNNVIWIVVMLQAVGGLVIALVVKYADNILKGFAVSLSIIISSFISWTFLGDFEPSLAFVVGAFIVILSTFLYGYEPKRPTLVHHA